MQTLLKFAVFIHVLSAAVWIGGSVVLELLSSQAVRDTRERLPDAIARASRIGSRVLGPSAALTVVFGIIAVALGRPAFGDLWVEIAIVAVMAAGAIGGGVVGRKTAKLKERADGGAAVVEIEVEFARIERWVLASLALLVFLVFDMVMKPTGFDPAFVWPSIVFFVAVLGYIFGRPSAIPSKYASAPRN